ncbi:hypothetical protein JL722_11543 [Aureococcus anophagefferens]|nr:hypothetical protein JL722_11543 [Aureococcus anophagefferens]
MVAIAAALERDDAARPAIESVERRLRARADFVDGPDGAAVADGLLFRRRLPEFVEDARTAVAALDFRANEWCVYFGTCDDGDARTRTSKRTCPARRSGASSRRAGSRARPRACCPATSARATATRLPPREVTAAIADVVLPSLGEARRSCVVQELFANVQDRGAWTNPHVHDDDFCGAIFYVDAPEGTRFCYDDSLGTPTRERWETYDPALVGPLAETRHHVEPQTGDLILAPVGWLRHWVPPWTRAADGRRLQRRLSVGCLRVAAGL